TDAAASDLTRSHGAEAFAVGHNIAFAPGMYRPGTQSGDHRIAHELTHVVQQGSGAISGGQARSVHSLSSEPAEQQAEATAAAIMRGQRVSISAGVHAASTRNRI